MNWLGYVGLALLVPAAVIAILGALVALPPALRLRKTAQQTSDLVEMYRQSVSLVMIEHDEMAVERELLLRPLRRIRRVVGHPLTLALLESYRRRRARRHAAAL